MRSYTLWTREKILQKIQELHSEDIDLRTSKIQEARHRKVYRAACNKFGNWKKALSKAGVKYSDLEAQIKEQKRLELLQKIKNAYDSGAMLDSESIKQDPENRTLYWSAKSFYKGRTFWEDTITDAGIDPADVVVQQRWSKEKVKKKLIERSKKGKPMNITAIRNDSDETGLYKAIVNHFDSPEDALKYAGLKYRGVRKARKPYKSDEIIRDIIVHSLKGTNLNSSYITSKRNKNKKLKSLYWAATRRLEGWENALTISGIDPRKYIKRRRRWDKGKLKKEILKLYEQNEPLNITHIIENHYSLYKAVLRHIGSWRNVIEYCGLDCDEIVKQGPSLTPDEIVSGIKRLSNEGKNLDTISMEEDEDPAVRRVFQQAHKKFDGGWKEAVEKAGFDYNEIRLRREPYTIKELSEKIRELENKGVSLIPSELQGTENHKYYHAAMRRYDTWGSFLDEIGIDSSKYISRVDWENGKAVLEYLRITFPAGIATGTRTKDPNLAQAALIYFNGIENAVKRAGLVYSKSGKITKKMLEDDPEILGVLFKHNREFLERIAKKVYYGAILRELRTLEIGDLFSEAFMILYETIPKKPPKVDLRRYTYKHIYYGLINLNKKHFRDVYVDREELLDLMKSDI